MKASEEKLSKSQQKEKIRKRYKGIDPDELEVIPALPKEELYDENKEKRVAVYARVSTDDPRQTSSYELQKNHYEDVVNRKPGWKLIKIYADEGITGTWLKHRDAFIEMIKDCEAGKIDLILTKSVARFARNVLDCIGYVRKLGAMNPPIGVFFEAENLYTLDKNSEMALSFIATLAQEESHNKSEIMNASIEMRFSRGIFLTPPLLGYDQDEEGNLVINEEEAKTVRLIFFMYLYGYSCQTIAETLEQLGRKTKKGRVKWTASSVVNVLRNERHCGDVLARKTYTPNYLDHKSKPNKQNRNQYRRNDNHEAIVSRQDYITVQHLLDMGRTGSRSILPELKVIETGVLKGFITVNPTWSGFKPESYLDAYRTVVKDNTESASKEKTIKVHEGEFDLRGYQVAYGQFFNMNERIIMNITNKKISFNSFALDKLGDSQFVELLVEPKKRQFALRETTKENRCSLKWFNYSEGGRKIRQIGMAACLPMIYGLFGWNPEYKYKLTGRIQSNGKEAFILFDISDAEVQIPDDVIAEGIIGDESELCVDSSRRTVTAYPSELADRFGQNYYAHVNYSQLPIINLNYKWDVDNKGKSFIVDEAMQLKNTDDMKNSINEIISDMREDQMHD